MKREPELDMIPVNREREPRTERPLPDRRTEPPRSRKKRRKRHSFLKRFLFILLLLLALAVFFLVHTVNSVFDRMNYEPIGSLSDAPIKTNGVTNILLIGSDSREQSDSGRSDAMMLLSINGRTGTIYLTSFLRDMYVEIPGHGNNRLNMAYSYGGAELLMETLKQNFDIDVNRYVLVNFQAFAHLLDAAGGVDLELTNAEVIYVNGYLAEYNSLENRPAGTDYLDESMSGLIHLNGPQALAYCRNRYIGTDFARTGRQRKVLSAVVKQAPLKLLLHFGELTRTVPPELTTNLEKDELLRLGLQAPLAVFYEIEQASIPVDGSYSDVRIDGMDVLQVDFAKNKEYLRQTLYPDGDAARH